MAIKRTSYLLLPVLVALLLTAGPSVYSYASALVGRWGSGATETDDIRIDASTNSLQTIDYAHHEVHAGSHYYIEGYTTLGVGGTLFVKLTTPDSNEWTHFLWDIGSNGILTTTLDEDATGGMAGGSRGIIHANNRNVGCWTGSHTGADDQATVMTDSTQTWTPDALIGYQIFNSTDLSSGIITDNDVNTVTVAALAGGTGNDFDTSDNYEINNSQVVVQSGVTTATSYGQRVSNISFGSKASGGLHRRAEELILKPNTVYLRSFTSGTASAIVNFKATWYGHTDKH